jgi:large subunit ribosomal protein L15
MPLQRRLPKRGFKSALLSFNAEVTLKDLESLAVDVINRDVLVEAKIIRRDARCVKLIKCGSISRPFHLTGIKATAGAKQAVESAGGSVS